MFSSNESESAVTAVVEALSRDEVVAIPTDTVYGLAANPRSATAMSRLFELKQRPEGVPIAVLVPSVEGAKTILQASTRLDDLADRHWPGALTIVGRAKPNIELHIGSTTNANGIETVGLRVADHPFVQACVDAFGPIAATSANVHGSPTIVSPEELEAAFGGMVDVIVDGGVLEGLASTVVDISRDDIVVLRQGVVQVA